MASRRTLRIGLIAPPWVPVPPRVYGGTELVVDLLARGLSAAGHDVTLFATGDSECAVRTRWAYARAKGTISEVPVELNHVIQAYDALADVDIVHDHTILGPVWAQTGSAPAVVTTNHAPFTPELSTLYAAIGRRVPIIAISHHQRASAPNVPVARVIHHGLEVADFPLGSGTGGYVVFLGRMSPDKGPDRAIRAARRAGVPLKLAAKMWEPAERTYFERTVEPLLGDDAIYVGELNHRQKMELLADAAALLNPVQWPEPFGLVMIESLACGTPVIAFPEGAAPEIIRHGRTGFLCRDEAEMADAIGRAGTIDRATCRAHVQAHFSADRMVRAHEDLYLETLCARAERSSFGAASALPRHAVPS